MNLIYNTPECGFDEVAATNSIRIILNAKMTSLLELEAVVVAVHKRMYRDAGCEFDGGDCDEFIRNRPDCEVEDGEDFFTGDGMRNGKYNTSECSWDAGDCECFIV